MGSVTRPSSLVPELTPDLVDGLARPLHDVEGIERQMSLRAIASNHSGDPVGPVGAHMRNPRAAALAELLEEAGQGRYIGTFGGPDQSPREMVDDHCEVALALPEGDLVNPDPAQSCQLTSLPDQTPSDAFQDVSDCPPADSHEFGHRALGAFDRQPGDLLLKATGEAGAMGRPRNSFADDPVLGTPHPGPLQPRRRHAYYQDRALANAASHVDRRNQVRAGRSVRSGLPGGGSVRLGLPAPRPRVLPS